MRSSGPTRASFRVRLSVLFRGVRAPASLKLVGGRSLIRGVRTSASRSLPGRTRPGLIEAPSLMSTPSRPGIEAAVRHLFRGVRAPASLKPHGALIQTAAMPAEGLFRGVRAPASLKRSSEKSLPGRTRPGLIEAGVRVEHPADSGSSGAYAPRPHLPHDADRDALPGRTRTLKDRIHAGSSGAYAPRPH